MENNLFEQRVIIDFSDEAKAFLRSLVQDKQAPTKMQGETPDKKRRDSDPEHIEISNIACAYGVKNAMLYHLCKTLGIETSLKGTQYYVNREQAGQLADELVRCGISRQVRKRSNSAY